MQYPSVSYGTWNHVINHKESTSNNKGQIGIKVVSNISGILKAVLVISLLVLVCMPAVFHSAAAQYGCTPISGGYEPKIIATKSSDTFVIWNYFFGCGQRMLLFDKISENETAIGSPIIIADPKTAGSTPVVANTPNGDTLYIAWLRVGQQPSELYLKKSTDHGATFSHPLLVNTNSSLIADISGLIVSDTDPNKVGIIWYGDSRGSNHEAIFLSISRDGGKSFEQPTLLSRNASAMNNPSRPIVFQTDSKVYLLWSVFSDDYGGDFVTTVGWGINDYIVISTASLGKIGAVAIAASGDNVYVVGADSPIGDNVGRASVVLVKSKNAGLTFDNPLTLTHYNGSATDHINAVTINAADNFVYATWYDFHAPDNGADIFTRASSDYGSTFGSIQRLNYESSVSEPLVTMALGEKYYASWQQAESRNGTDYQNSFFTSSSNGGKTFSQPIILKGIKGISNGDQSLALDNGKDVYVVWLDYGFTDGNHVLLTKYIESKNNFTNPKDLDLSSQVMADAYSTPEFGPIVVLLEVAGLAGAIVCARYLIQASINLR